MCHKLDLAETEYLVIKQTISSSFGKNTNKQLKFFWTVKGGHSFQVCSYQKLIGFYSSLEDAIKSYNGIA